MPERILVAYAGDESGRDAVALTGVLAAVTGAGLSVVFPYHPLLAGRDAEEVREQLGAEVERELEKVLPAAALETPTLHWSPSPWPIHALHELASFEHADLIVFGAAKHGLGDRLHISLMERMVHGAPCAVAVAPPGYEQRAQAAVHDGHALGEIGVGFAISPEGHAAARLACELAGLSDGHVCVLAGAGLEPALASYAFSSPALEEVERDIYAQTEQTLARFCAELGDGTPLDSRIVRGDPASVLIDASTKLDLLVLGSRAYGPLRHVLLGSVSARAMREAHCPVLVMPRGVPGGDERDHGQRARAVQHS